MTVLTAPPMPAVASPWTVRVADGEDDVAIVHRWNSEPHVAEYWHQAWPIERWRAELNRQREGDHSLPCLLALDGGDLAYVEVYRVARDRLAEHCATRAHDLGVHIAIGDPARTGRGTGRAALRAVAQGLLAADPLCDRVLAEPDVGNVRSVRAFAAAGFVSEGQVLLPDKRAELMIHYRTTEEPLP